MRYGACSQVCRLGFEAEVRYKEGHLLCFGDAHVRYLRSASAVACACPRVRRLQHMNDSTALRLVPGPLRNVPERSRRWRWSVITRQMDVFFEPVANLVFFGGFPLLSRITSRQWRQPGRHMHVESVSPSRSSKGGTLNAGLALASLVLA